MTSPEITGRRPRFDGLFAVIGAFCGLILTQFLPMIGLALGIAAALVVVLFFIVKKVPRWAAWLLAGVAIGVAIYYLLALIWILNPAPASGSGSGGPT